MKYLEKLASIFKTLLYLIYVYLRRVLFFLISINVSLETIFYIHTLQMKYNESCRTGVKQSHVSSKEHAISQVFGALIWVFSNRR